MRVSLVVVLATAVAGCAPVAEEPAELMARLQSAPAAERDLLVRDADFNGWGQVADATMTPLAGTSWYSPTETLHPSARIEYAIAPDPADDGKLEMDPENPRTVEGLSRLYSELRMPGYAAAPELVEDPSLPGGRTVETELESRIRGNVRKVFIYLPPGYDEDPNVRYPTAYFGDGPSYVSNLRVPRILDYAIAHREIAPLVAVFVAPMPRQDEYTMNEDYRRFVVEELVPWIDAGYRTVASPESRAILGSSLGALAALDLAWFHPEVFGACGAFAPAVSPWSLTDLVREGDVKPIRFFVLVGLYDLRLRPDGLALRDVLLEKGYDAEFLEFPEGHSVNAWRSYIDDVLMRFFPAEAASG